ncbi:hypothetical protein [Geoalkalibacter subterraneus]|uniref:hypothetical protein n=1 Tax=Geoalkalibacter subterraneus TaxID=483547 RepID=UPI00130DFEC0|nr:hypothetical protein [Geoalkalibacter subterraneus]
MFATIAIVLWLLHGVEVRGATPLTNGLAAAFIAVFVFPAVRALIRCAAYFFR